MLRIAMTLTTLTPPTAPNGEPNPKYAIEALHLLWALTIVLLVFVVMIGIITARRRARLRRERILASRTEMADAWAESARRLTIVPSEIRNHGPRPADDRNPPPHDDDPPPDGQRRRPRKPR
jgi:hypothetical protein